MKIVLYLITFLVLLIIHVIFRLSLPFADQPLVLAGITILRQLVLGLLFLAIYKKLSFFRFKKYIAPALLIIWLFVSIAPFEYIAQQKVIVTDIFDKPLEGITVNVVRKIPLLHGSSYQFDFYTTDNTGTATTKRKAYYGSYTDTLEIYANGGPVPHDTEFVENKSYDDAIAGFVYPKRPYGIIGPDFILKKTHTGALSPFKVDYGKCDNIKDDNKKLSCLKYGTFYSAIKERNPEICEYDDGLEFSRAACLTILALQENNPLLCSRTENTRTEMSRDACYLTFALFGPGDCATKTEYDRDATDACIKQANLPADLKSYLCSALSSKSGTLYYENTLYFSEAAELYRKMFCD